MHRTSLRAHTAARMESLEARQLLSLVPAAPAPTSTTSPDCGCGSGDSHTVYVDDDHMQCPNAMFTSIQAAVVYATVVDPTIDTIRVCPGVYHEQVTVAKPQLRLLGPQSERDARCRCESTPSPTRDAIIEPPPATVADVGLVTLTADGIEFDGFVVRNNPTGPGIATYPPSSGYLIENNIVRNNVFGIYFNSGGANRSLVRRNCIDNNNQGVFGVNAGHGDGIYSDGLHNAAITENRFERHETAAVVLSELGHTDVDITCNQLINDSTIVLFSTDHGRVANNLSYNGSGTGILLGGNDHDVDVVRNAVIRTSASGIASADFLGTGQPNTDIQISCNLLFENGRHGISLSNITESKVESNYALRNGRNEPGDGIRLGQDATYNCVQYNRSERNSRDGIRADLGSAQNVIFRNRMRYNLEHDAHDDTVGPYNAPAFVANQWIDNDCRTQNKPGLCDNCGCGCGSDDGHDDQIDDDERSALVSHEALVDQDSSLYSVDPTPDTLLVGLLPISGRKYDC